jgi:16S rRNA (cytidine1402-2'-O)-methyltransferase
LLLSPIFFYLPKVSAFMPAKLIFLDLPIGNMSDLTIRVREALASDAFFIVEDKKKFQMTLHHFGLSSQGKKIGIFHEHTPREELDLLLSQVEAEEVGYYCSDAGNPVLSDPGMPLWKAAERRGIVLDVYPGPSAVTAALTLSGLPPYPFQFHGFFPRKTKERMEALTALGVGTHLFFESPKRIKESLITVQSFLGGYESCREVVCVREISKPFQEVKKWEREELLSAKAEDFDHVVEKGEYVLLLWITENHRQEYDDLRPLAEQYLQEKRPKILTKLLATLLNRDSKEIYKQLFEDSPR